MIISFKDQEAERVFRLERSPKLPPEIQRTALRRLLALHAAASVADLREPPSNHLEKLTGDRDGQFSIRINDQWRICFRWRENNAYEVEIVDYHWEKSMETLSNVHPGEVLDLDFLRPLGITAYRLAQEIGVPQTRISQIIRGKRPVSLDTAVRLGRYFGTSAEFWINLQTHFDLEELRFAHSSDYDRIRSFKMGAKATGESTS